MKWICLTSLGIWVFCTSGCVLIDPHSNPKTRYAKAMNHAERVLREAGSDLRPYKDHYDLMTFTRSHWDAEQEIMFIYKLYDFVRITDKPGPDHFVIAYDKKTGETYLRSDLRSNKNLESLPKTDK